MNFANLYKKSDKVVFWTNVTTLLIALLILVFWQLNITNIPSQIPLFYSLPWGENQLASSSQFIIIPSLIALITLFNVSLSWYLHPSQYPLKRILAFSSFIVSILMLITSIKIIYLFI